MTYELSEINERTRKDPAAFVEECDASYEAKIARSAERIYENISQSRIVLLSGPSGSGKTTTAKKIQDELKRRGVNTHTVSLDDYFKTLDPKTAPRTPSGDIDYESPELLDMELINEHFAMLEQGRTIEIPHFIFSRQKRSANIVKPLHLGKNEIAIFEGIHALNDMITVNNPKALKLYISASSSISDNGRIVFERTWIRLSRRVVRDDNFRGSNASFTLALWSDVLNGEILYINPFEHKANIMFDTTLPYEVPLMKKYAVPLFETVTEDNPRHDEVHRIIDAFELFEDLDASYVRRDSLMREFIGGSKYSY